MSLESASHGEDLARKITQEGNTTYPLENPRVQGFLAMLAYGELSPSEAMTKWVEGDAENPPLSGPYRSYIEKAAIREIDVKNTAAMGELLEAVKQEARDTLH